MDVAYIASVILSIAGAVIFGVNAMTLFGIDDSGVVGRILTGILASGGSNYAHNKLRHISQITIEEIVEENDN